MYRLPIDYRSIDLNKEINLSSYVFLRKTYNSLISFQNQQNVYRIVHIMKIKKTLIWRNFFFVFQFYDFKMKSIKTLCLYRSQYYKTKLIQVSLNRESNFPNRHETKVRSSVEKPGLSEWSWLDVGMLGCWDVGLFGSE